MLESKQGTIREALCDNFDTPKAVNELFMLVK
jgi:cysteinyl-tRNA synthetase